MIFIHRELTLEVGDQTEEEITLWMVSYQTLSAATRSHARTFVSALARWCLSQGWLLETGEILAEDDLLPDAEAADSHELGGGDGPPL